MSPKRTDRSSQTGPSGRSSKSLRNVVGEICGSLGEEDGVDPRLYFRPKRAQRLDRKALQLCQQVAHALEYVLSEGIGDAGDVALSVVSVEPAPHAGRLLIKVAPQEVVPLESLGEIGKRLCELQPRLRSEVATSITRRKVPELTFVVLPHAGLFDEGSSLQKPQSADSDEGPSSLEEPDA